jgi:hypothetical protein
MSPVENGRWAVHERIQPVSLLAHPLQPLALYYKQHTDRAQIGVVTVPSGEFHSVTNDVNSYSQLALSGNGRNLATVLTSVDSSIALYGPDGGEPVSTLPLRVTPNAIAWSTEDRLLYIVEGLSIGTIDRATGSVQSFDTGEITAGRFIASRPDGHIRVCNSTSPSERDIEPAVHFRSKKELPLLCSENWGTNAGGRGEGDSLIASRIVVFRPDAGYSKLVNSRF